MDSVGAIVSNLAQWIGNQLVQEASLLYEVRDQVEWIQTELRRMSCLLKDLDAMPAANERIKNWRLEVRDVAYSAEDVIDTFLIKVAPARRGGFMGTIKRYVFSNKELKARHEVASEIERINIKIRSITESRLSYGIGNTDRQREGTSFIGQKLQERRLPSPFDQDTDFVGVADGLDALLKLLTRGKEQLSVVSIVGMGGLGKTTLAKRIFNHKDVKKHFQSCAWASISQNYAVRDVLQAIIKSCMVLSKSQLEEVEKMAGNDELKRKIADYLKDTTYLIVLDDLWAYTAWDDFKDAFPNDNKGSRILLTTRNENVALHADAQSEPHQLRCLSEEESRELLRRKVPLLRGPELDPQFESVAAKIVRRCHGLSLAIVVIGGLLSRKEPQEWNNVLNSISWQFAEGEVQIRGILSLSYKDLPYYLKPCFLYLGVFPEDYEFRAEKLIQLWAAEGLLEHRGYETLEEVGEDCLKELVQRSLIQIAKRSSSGGIKTCRTHDLIRDLSISEAKEDMFLEIHRRNMTTSAASHARRFAIHHHIREHSSLNVSSHHLRSLLLLPSDKRTTHLAKKLFVHIISFKLLRVLDLKDAIIENLPSEIGALIHLRYLGFHASWPRPPFPSHLLLPSSLGNLYNLQTLNISYYVRGLPPRLPKTIGKMQQLRHLLVEPSSQFNWFYRRIDPTHSWGKIKGHPQLDQLSNLQTLMGIEANSWIRSCLAKLTNLKKLGISLDEFSEESCKFMLKLDSLRSLILRATFSKTHEWVPLAHLINLRELALPDVKLEKLPELSKFPRNLTKLTLVGNFLKEDPLKTLEQLKSLQILKLRSNSYVGESMLCSEQGFPQLKTLHVELLPELKDWKMEKGSMPSLLHLRINSCPHLRNLSEGLEHVTTLHTLDLWDLELIEERHKIQNIPLVDIRDTKWLEDVF